MLSPERLPGPEYLGEERGSPGQASEGLVGVPEGAARRPRGRVCGGMCGQLGARLSSAGERHRGAGVSLMA